MEEKQKSKVPKQMIIQPFMPFQQAKGWVDMNCEAGCICPCCGQPVKRKVDRSPKLNFELE